MAGEINPPNGWLYRDYSGAGMPGGAFTLHAAPPGVHGPLFHIHNINSGSVIVRVNVNGMEEKFEFKAGETAFFRSVGKTEVEVTSNPTRFQLVYLPER